MKTTLAATHRQHRSAVRTAPRLTARFATRLTARVATRVGGRDDRGDVPGWVLITLMTAGLVTVLWAVAGDQLEQLFTDAIAGVTGPGAN
ncbi:hypothetical protein N865_16700 [Intrasporangium oryzae NRRL B-24470]|uniref:Uncharacterized protein n=1 Tax=Intrasporangium oryzae NRRL B-24470 TaxID=1386089 RepID=W9G8N9_9MICO|nr:hypothetical protein [Intrasporangium oryzae]EWT00239.1 hypothetical protein N865_16700 [Intrasporangium oryzae NRRL B-24470]